MNTERKAYIALALLAFLSIVQNCWYWNELPEKIATHFNLQGQADSWMSKGSATALILTVQIGLPWMLIGITALTGRLPTSMINLPNREYWLHPTRREQSLAYVRAVISWLAVAFAIHVMVINHLTFLANRDKTNLSTFGVMTSMILVFAAVFILLGNLFWRFRLPVAPDVNQRSGTK